MWKDVPRSQLFDEGYTLLTGRQNITPILRAMVARGMSDHLRLDYWDAEDVQKKGRKRGRRSGNENEDPFAGKRGTEPDGLVSKRVRGEMK